MNQHLVIFKIEDEKRKNGFLHGLQSTYHWARVTETAYVVCGDADSASEVRNDLSANLVTSDRLFVVDITESEWASLGIPREVTNWINA